jgi:ankyrin repeat protein
MSSTPVLSFIKDITAKNIKAVQDRLKATQSPNQSFADPKEQGLSYRLLHKAVEVGSLEIVSALLAAGADVNAPDTRGRTPLHWLASSTDAGAVNTAGKFWESYLKI